MRRGGDVIDGKKASEKGLETQDIKGKILIIIAENYWGFHISDCILKALYELTHFIVSEKI